MNSGALPQGVDRNLRHDFAGGYFLKRALPKSVNFDSPERRHSAGAFCCGHDAVMTAFSRCTTGRDGEAARLAPWQAIVLPLAQGGSFLFRFDKLAPCVAMCSISLCV